jgi:hypothetical protein
MKMKKKVFGGMCLVSVITLLIASVSILYILYGSFTGQIKTELATRRIILRRASKSAAGTIWPRPARNLKTGSRTSRRTGRYL